jgi:3-hydroxyisobutyrate dehydrogenase-like beta-hydroxyacid dehydrogenase
MARVAVGLLHPGEMGAALGQTLHERGHEVFWASDERSEATTRRAAAAGLRNAGSVEELARSSEIVISVCPPHAAGEVARSLHGFEGVYVDANALAPATTRRLGAKFRHFVDGGIIGPPPSATRRTRLYIAGQRAAEIATLFAGTAVDARILSDVVGDASALKMVYAAWTKGTAALLLAIREVARAEGIEEELLEEWRGFEPELLEQWEHAAGSAAAKGWRWVGEMEEIAATFAAAGQPDGFHRAAAEIYRRST